MLRLGSAKPGSWASFWAILTLVGLATRAGEWAVGGGGGWEGPGREAGPLGPSCTRPGGGGVQLHACLRGKKGWEAGLALADKKTFLESIVPDSGAQAARRNAVK